MVFVRFYSLLLASLPVRHRYYRLPLRSAIVRIQVGFKSAIVRIQAGFESARSDNCVCVSTRDDKITTRNDKMQVLAYKLMLNFLNFSSVRRCNFSSLFPHSPLFIRAEAEAEAPECPSFVSGRAFILPHRAFILLHFAFILNFAAHQSALSFLSTYSSPCPVAAASIIGRSWS